MVSSDVLLPALGGKDRGGDAASPVSARYRHRRGPLRFSMVKCGPLLDVLITDDKGRYLVS